MKALRLFTADGVSALNPSAEPGLFIALGKCLSAVAYGQLIAENCQVAQVPLSTVSVLFHVLIEDLNAEASSCRRCFRRGVPREGC